MASTWLIELLLIFQPEDSSPNLPVKQEEADNPLRGALNKTEASLKAFVWIIISVVFGLFIGQL